MQPNTPKGGRHGATRNDTAATIAWFCICVGLTFELSGRQRHDARPGLAKM